jgi:hypothetical protein
LQLFIKPFHHHDRSIFHPYFQPARRFSDHAP